MAPVFFSQTFGLSGHCSSGQLVHMSPVLVLTDVSPSSGTSRGQARGSRCGNHPSMIAKEVLVSAGLEPAGRPSSASSRWGGSLNESTG